MNDLGLFAMLLLFAVGGGWAFQHGLRTGRLGAFTPKVGRFGYWLGMIMAAGFCLYATYLFVQILLSRLF